MRKAFIQALNRKMEADKRLVLLLADVGRHACRDIFNDYPDRDYDLGIREQAIIGIAAGLAKSGMIPVIYGIAPFIVERAYEQIKLDLGLNELQAIIVTVGASYDYAAEGPTHQCPGDVAILSQIPGMEIYVPAFTGEIEGILDAAIERGKPTYIRLSEVSAPGGIKPPQPGEAAVLWGGNKATVLAIGPAIFPTMEALIPKADARIIYTNRVKPLPDDLDIQEPLLLVEPFYPAMRFDGIVMKRVAFVVQFPGIENMRVVISADGVLRAYKELINERD